MRFVKEGWPHAFSEELKDFKKLENSLSTENGCVFYGLRVIIPSTLRNLILKLLHLGHFGMQRMKQLARSTVYWPRIDFDIEDLCRKCTSCGQFQNKPDKPSIHPWMMPEKPWFKTPLGPCDQLSGKKLVSPCRRLFKISLHSSNNLNVFEKYYCYTWNKNLLISDIPTRW